MLEFLNKELGLGTGGELIHPGMTGKAGAESKGRIKNDLAGTLSRALRGEKKAKGTKVMVGKRTGHDQDELLDLTGELQYAEDWDKTQKLPEAKQVSTSATLVDLQEGYGKSNDALVVSWIRSSWRKLSRRSFPSSTSATSERQPRRSVPTGSIVWMHWMRRLTSRTCGQSPL